MQLFVSSRSGVIFLLGLLAAFGSNMGLTTSHVTLAQYGAYELQPKPSGILRDALRNKPIQLILAGMMLAQVLVFLSVYVPPMYAIWVRPQLWTMCLGPYLVHYAIRMLGSSIPMNFTKLEERYDDEHIQAHLFLDGFVGQLINPIVWPTPIFSRLLTAALFRYSHTHIFIGGVVVGWLAGYASLIGLLCFFIYALQYAVPGMRRNPRFTMVFYNFFRPLGYVILLATGMMGYHIVYDDFHPRVEMDTMRLKDGWPDVLFEANSYRRPLWLPPLVILDDNEKTLIETKKAYSAGKLLPENSPLLKSKSQRSKEDLKLAKKHRQKKVSTLASFVNLWTGRKKKQTQPQAEEAKRASVETKGVAASEDASEDASKDQDKQEAAVKIDFVFHPRKLLLNQKRFGDYWFRDCLDLGKQRLSHTFLPNLAFVHENLEFLVNYPALTLRDGNQVHKVWLDSLRQRRQRMRLHFNQRARLVHKARKRLAALAEKRTLLVHPIVTENLADQAKQRMEKHRRILTVLTMPLEQDVRLFNKSLGYTLPKDEQVLAETSMEARSEGKNQLQQWLLEKAKQFNMTWVLPWSPLSFQHCQVLPIVLNNQAVNYKPATLNEQQVTWAQFIDQYEKPLVPKYPIVEGDNAIFQGFRFWLHRLKLFAPIVDALKKTVDQRLGHLPNFPNAEKRMTMLVNLQKHIPLYTMSHVTHEGVPTGQMTNEQDLDDPLVGDGVWPVGFRANRLVTTDFGQPRRNHGMMSGQWRRQATILPPAYVHCRALQVPDEDENVLEQTLNPVLEFKYNLEYYRQTAQKGRSEWEQLWDQVMEVMGKSEKSHRRAHRFQKFVSELASMVHYGRGPILLGRMYLRQYLFVPTQIILKDIALRLAGLPSEINDDWEEFQNEHYIICDYQGKEPDLATDVEDPDKKKEEDTKQEEKGELKEEVPEVTLASNEPSTEGPKQTIAPKEGEKRSDDKPPKFLLKFPEKWWEEGLQVKIRAPFRLRPSRQINDDVGLFAILQLKEQVYDKLPSAARAEMDSMEYRSRNLIEWLEAKSTFLTLKGEVEAPGLPPPDIVRRPFIRLYTQAFKYMMQRRLRILFSPLLRLNLTESLPYIGNSIRTRMRFGIERVVEGVRRVFMRVHAIITRFTTWFHKAYAVIQRIQVWLQKRLSRSTRLPPVISPESTNLTVVSPSTSIAHDTEAKPALSGARVFASPTIAKPQIIGRERADVVSMTWSDIWSKGIMPLAYTRPTLGQGQFIRYLRLRGKPNDLIYRLAITRWRTTHRNTVRFLLGYMKMPAARQRHVAIPRYLESAVWDIVHPDMLPVSHSREISHHRWYHDVFNKGLTLPGPLNPRRAVDVSLPERLLGGNALMEQSAIRTSEGTLLKSLRKYFRQRLRIVAAYYLRLGIQKELPLWLKFQVKSLPSRIRWVLVQLHTRMLFLQEELLTRWEQGLRNATEWYIRRRYSAKTVEFSMSEFSKQEAIKHHIDEDREFTVQVILKRLDAYNLLAFSPETYAHTQNTLRTLAKAPRTRLQLQRILRRHQTGFTPFVWLAPVKRCLRFLNARMIKLTRAERKLTREQLIRKLNLSSGYPEVLKLTRQDLRDELRRLKTRLLLGGTPRKASKRNLIPVNRRQWFKLLRGQPHCFVPTNIWSMWQLPTERQVRRLPRTTYQVNRSAPNWTGFTVRALGDTEVFMVNSVINASKSHQWRSCVQAYLDAARGTGFMNFARRYHAPVLPVQTYYPHQNTPVLSLTENLKPLENEEVSEPYFNFDMNEVLDVEQDATDTVLKDSTLSIDCVPDWHAGEYEAVALLRKRLRRYNLMINNPEDFPDYSPNEQELQYLQEWSYFIQGRNFLDTASTSGLEEEQDTTVLEEDALKPSKVSSTARAADEMDDDEMDDDEMDDDETVETVETDPNKLADEEKGRRMYELISLSKLHFTWEFIDWRIPQLPEWILTYTVINPVYEFIAKRTSLAPWLLCRKQRITDLLTDTPRVSLTSVNDSLLLPETQREYRVLNLLRLSEEIAKEPGFRTALQPQQVTLEAYFDRFLWSPYRFEDLACMNRFWVGTVNQGKLSFMRIRMYPLVKP